MLGTRLLVRSHGAAPRPSRGLREARSRGPEADLPHLVRLVCGGGPQKLLVPTSVFPRTRPWDCHTPLHSEATYFGNCIVTTTALCFLSHALASFQGFFWSAGVDKLTPMRRSPVDPGNSRETQKFSRKTGSIRRSLKDSAIFGGRLVCHGWQVVTVKDAERVDESESEILT